LAGGGVIKMISCKW